MNDGDYRQKNQGGMNVALGFLCLFLCFFLCVSTAMGQKRTFTLDDLIVGGEGYKTLMPQTKDLWWDGNVLVDGEERKKPEEYPLVVTKEHNIFITQREGGEEKAFTTDGTREVTYGEPVHRNEFGITKGIFMSPDRGRFAFYKMDQTMVADYPQVNTFEREAVCEPDKYPMAGMVSHKVEIGIGNVKGSAEDAVWLDLDDTTDRYFTNIAWAPDGESIYLIEVDRKQRKASLDRYSAVDGHKIGTIDTEKDGKYVEPQHPIAFLPWDDSKFIMWSQKSGWWHLYLYDAEKGKELKALTEGAFAVQELIGFCADGKSIIIRTTEKSPLQSNLYKVEVETGRRTLLDNGLGVHSGKLSADGSRMLDIYSTPDIPKAYEITDVRTGKREGCRLENDPWEGYAQPRFCHGSIKAADGKTDLHYRLVLPPGFDETGGEKLPVVVYVYNGPHVQLVNASWHWNARGWETYMAQKGFAVFVLDGRGSDNRGKDFEQVTWHQLGQQEMLDQMKGVEYLRSLPYIDKERMGVHGWSYGGFMATSLMLNYPETFKVGVAGGVVIDWKWYEVMYGERYMGKPENNKEGYEKTSLLDKAKNLKGQLQLIMGMNDQVVVPQHTLQFINACNEAGKQPDLYVYPGQGHNMKGMMAVHLHERITRYFEKELSDNK